MSSNLQRLVATGFLVVTLTVGYARAAEPVPPRSWPDMIVVLTDGAIVRGADVAWTDDGRYLHLIRQDGAERRVLLAEVAEILDRAGRDHREEIRAAGSAEARTSGFFDPEVGDTRPYSPHETLDDDRAATDLAQLVPGTGHDQ